MKLANAAKVLAADVAASLLLGISIVVFTVQANFAPGGVSGIAVLLNYLFDAQIGLATVLINVPIIVLTFRHLGPMFFALSIKTMLINALFIDYVVAGFPVYTGSRLLSCIFAGITAGMCYSIVFNMGSSTGGTDFIIAAIKKWKPKLSFGFLVMIIDGTIIALSVFVYREIWSLVYGIVYTLVTSAALDATTYAIEWIRRKMPCRN